MTKHEHIWDEYDLCYECDTPKPTQSAWDRTYREKQKSRGVVRKTVLVPESRVAELHALLRAWRAEN